MSKKSNIYFMAANDSKYNNNVVGGQYHLKSKNIPAGSILVLMFKNNNDEWYVNMIRRTIGTPKLDNTFKNHYSTDKFVYAVNTRLVVECNTPIYLKDIFKQNGLKHSDYFNYFQNPNIALGTNIKMDSTKKKMYASYKTILAEIAENI